MTGRYSIATLLPQAWYSKSRGLIVLWPLAILFGTMASLRRALFKHHLLACWQAPVPVIVVGNISVGGTGKTPLVISLVAALQRAGFNPGIVSRGYGSRAPDYPFSVKSDTHPDHSGDEPLLLARRCGVAVVIDSDRVRAAQFLLEHNQCDVIISDDGLQHYRLDRHVEIVVVDGSRGFGNQQLLPMGPLREPLARLREVDFLVSNGELLEPLKQIGAVADNAATRAAVTAGSKPAHFAMAIQATALHSLQGDSSFENELWPYSRRVHAVAGIGNPQRFYQTLRQLGFEPIEHDFLDHHHYCVEDLQFGDDLPVIMTEKDAVKVACLSLTSAAWFLSVEAALEADFYAQLITKLGQYKA